VKRHKGDRNRERRGSENGYGGDRNGYGGERKRKDRKRRYHVEFVVSQLQRERKCSEKGKVNFINCVKMILQGIIYSCIVYVYSYIC
jgi:hypothetical protein